MLVIRNASTVTVVYVNIAIKHMNFYSDVNSRHFMTVNIRIHLKKAYIQRMRASRRHLEADRQWMAIFVASMEEFLVCMCVCVLLFVSQQRLFH